jgi:hypothetical protein
MWRKAEWHHHRVAAVDTGLTAALTRRLIRFILPPVSADPPALHVPPITTKMPTGVNDRERGDGTASHVTTWLKVAEELRSAGQWSGPTGRVMQ